MRQADLALYRAKANGRNRWCLFEPQMEEAKGTAMIFNWAKREMIMLMPEQQMYMTMPLKEPQASAQTSGQSDQKVEKTGKEIVETVCAACHASGALGAPKIGDKGAWAKHIGGGLDHLKQLAIKGNGAMPARGGNPDLSDIEVTRAIVYMANQSGASFKEPAAAPA